MFLRAVPPAALPLLEFTVSFDILPDTLPEPEPVPLGVLPVVLFLPQDTKQNKQTAKNIKNKTVLLFFIATDFSFHVTVFCGLLLF